MRAIIKPIFILTTLFCFSLKSAAQFATNQPKQEIRAVWLTTILNLDWPTTRATNQASVERQKQELIDILDQLKAANFNTIVFQTRTRAAVLYPSKIEPWDNCLTGKFGVSPGYDPLQFAIDECHKRGMQIHAWLVTIPGNKTANSKAMGNTALEKRHPELVIKSTDGKGESSYMLDPGLPETAEYLATICEEVVSNYDIDGINFDYIRYPSGSESKFSDAASYKKYGNGLSKADWHRSNINHIVETIHDRVKAIKPWVAISCSPVGKYADTKRYASGGWNSLNAVSQDAKLWVEKGWMDILMPMMYFKGNNFFPFALDWQEGSNGRSIATGLGVYMIDRNQKDWPRSTMESEITFTRDHGLAGQVFFRSKFITDNPKGMYDLLKYNLYATKATLPALAGDNNPKPQTPAFGNISEYGNAWILNWESQENCTYNLYRSNTYPVDITKAGNVYQVGLTTPQHIINTPIPYNWLPYYAVTAVNRYGEESQPLELNKEYKPIKIEKVQ